MQLRSLFVLCLLWMGDRAAAQIPTNGLVGFYPFSGSTLDSSGLGNHASPAGCSYVADRFDQAASALYLDGITDSLVIPLPGYTPLTGDFSFSFWVKTNSPEPSSVLSLTQYPEDTVDNYNFYLNYYSPLQTIAELHYGEVNYWNGSGWASNKLGDSGSFAYTDGEWKHMVVRRRNDTIQFWNRRYPLAAYVYAGPIGDALPFVVGALPYRYKGAIDDIAFYNRAITDQEIHRLQHDRKPYIFTSSRNTDAYAVGDTAEIWFVGDTSVVSDSIHLDYSTDGGATWLPSGHPQGLDYTPFRWALPFAQGTDVILRMTDLFDSTITASTVAFHMSEYRWERVDDTLPFTPRDGVGMLNYDGKLWLLGGWDPPYHMPDNTHSEVWNSADGINWTYLGDAPWQGRHDSGWMVHDGALWLVGGDYQSGALRDVWRSTDGANWTQILDTIPNIVLLRHTALTASFQGNLYYMGGQPYGNFTWNFNEVRRSPDGVNWTQLADAPWPGRGMTHTVVDDHDSLWVLGGGRALDRRCFNDVWKTGDGVSWEQVTESAPWDPRYWHNTAYFDDQLWVLCGIVEQTNASDVWYSSDGKKWYELKNSRFDIRHAASAATFDNSLWLMCGISTNDSWRLRNINAPTAVAAPADEAIGLRWYPNPTDSRVRSSQYFQSARVFNGFGQQVLATAAGHEIDLTGLPAGVYIVQATRAQGRTQASKIVKF